LILLPEYDRKGTWGKNMKKKKKGKSRERKKKRRGIGRNQAISFSQVENSNIWGT
jgi:hypothetical protein